jgi:hypothetical protein
MYEVFLTCKVHLMACAVYISVKNQAPLLALKGHSDSQDQSIENREKWPKEIRGDVVKLKHREYIYFLKKHNTAIQKNYMK